MLSRIGREALRGEAESAVDSATGAPTYCDFNIDECVIDDRTCQGVPYGCYYMDELGCAQTLGCYGSNECSGVAWSCITFDGDSSGCATQAGCTYD